MLAILRPRVVVPMHYQIPTISEQPKDLGPIDPWLATRKNVRKLSSNELSLRRESLPVALETIVFLPSPAVKAWPASFLQARAKFDEADRTFKTNPEAVEALLRETVRLFPEGLEFWFVLGGNLATEGRMWEAIEALERGLLAGQRDEWGYQWRTRDRLAKLYEKVGEKELAIVQYRQIADSCPVIDLREEAVASLVRLQMK